MAHTIHWFANSMEQEAQELVRGLRRRDPDLLDRLIERYHYRLLRYLSLLVGHRETAEDLFQETWIRVLEKGHQYRAQWKFESWLFTVARNLAIDFLRRRQPQSLEALLEDAPGAPPRDLVATNTPTGFDTLAQSEEAGRLAAVVAALPPAYREVLVLRFQEDLALEEIAGILSAPLSTVKSRLYRGLEALRERWVGETA